MASHNIHTEDTILWLLSFSCTTPGIFHSAISAQHQSCMRHLCMRVVSITINYNEQCARETIQLSWATTEMRGERIITTTCNKQKKEKNRQTQLILYYLTRTEPPSTTRTYQRIASKYVCEFTRIKRARCTHETRNTSCGGLRKCHWNEKYVMLFFVWNTTGGLYMLFLLCLPAMPNIFFVIYAFNMMASLRQHYCELSQLNI